MSWGDWATCWTLRDPQEDLGSHRTTGSLESEKPHIALSGHLLLCTQVLPSPLGDTVFPGSEGRNSGLRNRDKHAQVPASTCPILSSPYKHTPNHLRLPARRQRPCVPSLFLRISQKQSQDRPWKECLRLGRKTRRCSV